MSSRKTSNVEKKLFVERFIEICGSSQTNDIARLLNISYQAAKNYLNGRLPDSSVLKTIAEKTPFSINWLLTGEGEKLTAEHLKKDALQVTDQMQTFVREICLEVVSEVFSNQAVVTQQKTVVLTSENIKEETLLDQSAILSEKETE